MVKNINELKEKIDMINQLLPSFDTDERKEIKKNNKLIEEYVAELSECKNIILGIMKDKKEGLIPKMVDNNLDDNLDKMFEKVRYLSDNSYISKLYIDKNLHEIRYSASLDKVNENINDLINKFLLIGVNLSNNDFKYSISLYKYMSYFFENKSNPEFGKLMAGLFDTLYWECSDIVYHIYLSFVLLLDKYSDKFELYIKKCNESCDYDEELNKYLNLKKDVNEIVNCNESLIYNKFINSEYRIEDYLADSVIKREIISKYIDYDKYNSLEERKYFYEQINGMYLDFCEYLDLTKYKFLIDKVREVYATKSSNASNFANVKKNIKSLNGQRDKLNNKVFGLYNRLKGKTKGLLFNKYNSLFNKVNAKIIEIIDVYNKYDYDCFVNDVFTKLNDDSSCYDVLKIYENNYSYLLKLLEENNCNYLEFIDFLYDPYLSICKIIPFINDFDIKDKLINKYDLFDMNFNMSDENKLHEELKYIIRLWNLEKGNIDLNKIKLIIDINKIKLEEI